MMKRTLITLTVVLALASGCKQKDAASVSSESKDVATTEARHTLTPEQLGELGARIEKAPDQAATLLGEHGLNEKTFEQEIRKVTEDPEASKRYASAYEKAKA
jgi:hypothetical protein